MTRERRLYQPRHAAAKISTILNAYAWRCASRNQRSLSSSRVSEVKRSTVMSCRDRRLPLTAVQGVGVVRDIMDQPL